MSTDITILISIAVAIVPFTNALVGIVRKALPKLPSQYVPFFSLGFGLLLGGMAFFLPDVKEPFIITFLAGGISGLASCGVYDLADVKTALSSTTTAEKK